MDVKQVVQFVAGLARCNRGSSYGLKRSQSDDGHYMGHLWICDARAQPMMIFPIGFPRLSLTAQLPSMEC